MKPKSAVSVTVRLSQPDSASGSYIENNAIFYLLSYLFTSDFDQIIAKRRIILWLILSDPVLNCGIAH